MPPASLTPSLSAPGSRSAPIGVGSVLGDNLEIVGVLGEGGTGVVYDARRLREGDRVALKVIHRELAGDRQIRGRFTREAAILRRLEGAHLCPLLDFGELADPRDASDPRQGLLYMVLPKIDGIGLDRLIESNALLPLERAVAIALGICAALQEAHAQGIIHRDLKPGNVLLREGDDVVVVDFGMAKIVTGGGGTGTTNLTQHNMVFGTPEYMAPEQARGDELDARCDIYAAGIILYELLTGSVPFRGGSPLNVLTAQLTSAVEPPGSKAPARAIPRAIEAVVMHALAKDPAERYATAAAFARSLRAAKSAPDDVDSAAPSRRADQVSVGPMDTDAHAETMPSPDPSRIAATVRPLASARSDARPPSLIPSTMPSPPGSAPRATTLLFVVAATIGIAIGVWLSLR